MSHDELFSGFSPETLASSDGLGFEVVAAFVWNLSRKDARKRLSSSAEGGAAAAAPGWPLPAGSSTTRASRFWVLGAWWSSLDAGFEGTAPRSRLLSARASWRSRSVSNWRSSSRLMARARLSSASSSSSWASSLVPSLLPPLVVAAAAAGRDGDFLVGTAGFSSSISSATLWGSGP